MLSARKKKLGGTAFTPIVNSPELTVLGITHTETILNEPQRNLPDLYDTLIVQHTLRKKNDGATASRAISTRRLNSRADGAAVGRWRLTRPASEAA